MTREEFKARWESSANGGGITYDDVAECYVAWGLGKMPRTVSTGAVLSRVLTEAGVDDDQEEER